MSWTTTPPTGIIRTVARTPLWLFRRRLRWLLGNRFVRLTHRGRTTGRIRQTVLEVVRFDAETREIVVATIWQGRAHWYRNLQSAPALEVRTGRIAYQPTHRELSPDETYHEVSGYLQRNPAFVRSFYL